MAAACTSPSGSAKHEGTRLTQAQLGPRWPLTVPAATVHCRNPTGPEAGDVTVTINGVEYALNGLAAQENRWPAFADSGLWRHDPSTVRGVKVDITPLVDAGLKLCR